MLLIKGSETKLHPQAMHDAFTLRHKIFVEEKGWEDIRRSDGLESDQFDNENALHMMMYEDDNLIGYQRMLPTTTPYLLSEIYPYLCEQELPRDTAIWEWTRFAVSKEHRKSGRKLSPAGNGLLSAIVEWGLETNVHSIVIEMNPLWLLTLVQLHFRVTPLGIAHKLSNEDTLAVVASFDERTLKKLQEMRGNNEKIINSA